MLRMGTQNCATWVARRLPVYFLRGSLRYNGVGQGCVVPHEGAGSLSPQDVEGNTAKQPASEAYAGVFQTKD